MKEWSKKIEIALFFITLHELELIFNKLNGTTMGQFSVDKESEPYEQIENIKKIPSI